MKEFLTISELTNEIKYSLEEQFPMVSVIGEISNFKDHISGHWYFTLKDSNAQISCTMWRGINNYVYFTPQVGMKVIAKGRITVYPPRGSYQLDVRSMQPAGEGELQAAFERLKKKLAEEGLFADEHKKPIPRFPNKIGIVTAEGGAAFRDMLSVAKRRYPLADILIMPAKVQGEGAAEEIAANIKELNKRSDIDVILTGRGGGSIEDLWAFNEEVVAREIFASKIPVISGVGHEVDYTIADFVADLRAPTPTAAMELATPSQDEIFAFIREFSYNSTVEIFEVISRLKSSLDQAVKSYGFRLPFDIIKNKSQELDNLVYRLENGINKTLTEKSNRLALLTKSVEAHDKDKILKKGFSIVRQNGNIVPRAEKFDKDKKTKIEFIDNEVEVN
jgi:exodeoxyribonuclease VII large subunit